MLLVWKTALTNSLIKFCYFKIRSLYFFTQFFTTSGLDYTDLGWFLNQNINFNKPRRSCAEQLAPLRECGQSGAGEKLGLQISSMVYWVYRCRRMLLNTDQKSEWSTFFLFFFKLLFILMIVRGTTVQLCNLLSSTTALLFYF